MIYITLIPTIKKITMNIRDIQTITLLEIVIQILITNITI